MLFSVATAPVAPAQNGAHPLRSIHIERIENSGIHVDGRLDEPVWQKLTPNGDFEQMDPHEGQPITERTEVFIFYDHEKVYFGVKCFDSEPKKITRWLDARDARPLVDSVGIFLDPFGAKRSGYIFTVHAGGHQYDGLLAEGADPDDTWDGIWQSASHMEDWGWSVEIAIPFKSIRFSTDQPWGFNIRRDISRKNERAYWQFLPRFDVRFRPSKAGTLHGIEGIHPGRNIEIVPYVSAGFRRGAPLVADNHNEYAGGGDVRWGILPNATLNLTVNPDFADTEADEGNISLSRFELFFPEKRHFFNEGADFFRTPMNFFFSRRAGAPLADGTPQRILFGAKLTGKVGPWSLGMLESRTQEQDFTDPATGIRQTAPAANFFVLRMQRDIGGNSTIGFLTANRDQQPVTGLNAVGSTERIHAVDLHITGVHIQWQNQVAYSQNHITPEGGIHRAGLLSDFRYDSSSWFLHGSYKYLGRGFDVSAIGFEPEVDRHSGVGTIQYKPFINRHGVRQVFLELNQDISMGTHGELQDAGSDAVATVSFVNFWQVTGVYSYDRVRFNGFTPPCLPFGSPLCTAQNPPPFTALPRTQVYIDPKVRFMVSTNERRPFYLTYSFTARKGVQFNENFYGRQQNHVLTFTARLFRSTRIDFNGQYFRELLLDRTPFQDRRLFITRVNHQFTPKLRFRVLGQVSNDRHGQNFNVNSIFMYQFTARSAAIAGYNYQKHGPTIPGDLGNEFFAKFSYLIQF
ncbi:MAG: carbohydrate binding family 9 domain-containing protein [Acidobacteria bacterium]|nr:carbohydrate binding family 9 domain-containing protein [Acidobacteriota bacterium]